MQRFEYARVKRILPHPVEDVWLVLSAFGGLERWVDSVEACTVSGEGVGAVRTVVRNGASVRERLDLLDPNARLLAYLILDPHPLPAADVRSKMELRAIGPAQTEVRWSSEASRLSVPPERLRAQIESFFSRSIEGLDRLLVSKGGRQRSESDH